MTLLSDLLEFEFKEECCNEMLVSLRSLENVDIDETKDQISSKSEYFCYVRESVYSMLEKASLTLPDGYKFLIKEGYRPASIQQDSFNRIFKKYRSNFPEMKNNELMKTVSEFVAPLNVAGHPTGGAIDVTLMANGKEVFMDTRFNEEPKETNSKTYLASSNISKLEKEYRKILSEALNAVGFTNYPPEWWHWSFGDKYWAYTTNESVKYSIIHDKEIRNLTTASAL